MANALHLMQVVNFGHFRVGAIAGLLPLVACYQPKPDPEPYFAFELTATESGDVPIAGIPFPNDVLMDDGELRITAETLPFEDDVSDDIVQTMAANFQEMDCFGVSGGITLPTRDVGHVGVVVDTIGDTFHIVDLESGNEIPSEVHYRQREQSFHVRPTREHRLDEGTLYGVWVERGVERLGGIALESSDTLKELLSPEAPASELASAHATFEPMRAHLSATGVDVDDVVAATVYTTCTYTDQLQALADQILAQEVPDIVIDRSYVGSEALDGLLGTPVDNTGPGFDNEGGVAHADVGAVILGHFSSPYFLSEKSGGVGRINFEDGKGVIKTHEDIPFLLALPADVDSYENLPVLIFQHGLNNGRRHVLAVANTICSHGVAVIGIDIPFHGDRDPRARDLTHNFGDGPDEPDGIADASASGVGTFFNLQGSDGVTRLDPLVQSDNFRQAALDILMLSRVVTEGDPAPIAAVDATFAALSFNTERVSYSSESFGGFVGVTAVAISPALQSAFFGVAGGGLANHLLGNSPTYGGLFIPIISGTFSVPPNHLDPAFDPPHTHYTFQIMSMMLDWGDPLTYAHLLPGKGVHIALAAAFSDEAVPNQSSEALAAQLGLEWSPTDGAVGGPRYLTGMDSASVPTSGNRTIDGQPVTAAFFEIDPATHGMFTLQTDDRRHAIGFPPWLALDPPQLIDNPIRKVQTLMARFATSYVESGTPTLY